MRDLQGLEPDQQMLRIGQAFREAGPEVNRASASTELFTKQGRDAIPMLIDLDKAMQLTADIEPISAADAAAAEAFQMKVASLTEHVGDLSTRLGRAQIPAMSLLVDVAARTGSALVHIVDLGAWSAARMGPSRARSARPRSRPKPPAPNRM